MARVLLTEPLAESGLAKLRAAGHEVDAKYGIGPAELLEAVKGAHALIVRSATKVTAEVIDAGDDLVVVGRAGAGVDNVDVAAATKRGVMVVNAPGSNALATAEHTWALILSMARNIPQAHAALTAGRWEKSRWEGIELHGKTFGVLGIGAVGTLVAQRAHAFGMQLIGRDPMVTAERGRQLGIELVELDELFARADFLSIHATKTADTVGMVGKELLSRAKPGIRIINAARGGIIDEAALAEAIREGIVAGAALDVFETEPTTESPLFELPQVIVTPHLASSTPEAQAKAGDVVAEQVNLALAGDFVPFAINVAAAEASETVRPYLPFAERLGRIFGELSGSLPDLLEIAYQGGLADGDTRILTLSVLKGLFGVSSEEPVSYVNAPQLAEARGLEVRETKTSAAHDYVNLITLRGGDHSVAGTLAGLRGEPRIVLLDDHDLDVPPGKHMLVVRNDDRPGVIGRVGTVLGEARVNIADMDVGRTRTGATALMVLSTDEHAPEGVVDQLRAAEGVLSVHVINPG